MYRYLNLHFHQWTLESLHYLSDFVLQINVSSTEVYICIVVHHLYYGRVKGSYFRSTWFAFSCCYFLLVCWMITIFLLKRARLGGPLKYLEHVRQAENKFSRGLWKKFQSKKSRLVKIFQLVFWLHFLKILDFVTFADT